MQVQVITFNLHGATEEEYRILANSLAPTFAKVPGLLSKYWLADSKNGTYGGVYIWKNLASMNAYMHGDGVAVMKHPMLKNQASRDYGVLDGPTRINACAPVSER